MYNKVPHQLASHTECLSVAVPYPRYQNVPNETNDTKKYSTELKSAKPTYPHIMGLSGAAVPYPKVSHEKRPKVPKIDLLTSHVESFRCSSTLPQELSCRHPSDGFTTLPGLLKG